MQAYSSLALISECYQSSLTLVGAYLSSCFNPFLANFFSENHQISQIFLKTDLLRTAFVLCNIRSSFGIYCYFFLSITFHGFDLQISKATERVDYMKQYFLEQTSNMLL